MFDYAISCGLIDMNPVASIGTKTFQKQVSKHFDALKPQLSYQASYKRLSMAKYQKPLV